MGFVAAKCSQCGASIEVDDARESGFCSQCGTRYVNNKEINNYNVTNVYNVSAGTLEQRRIQRERNIALVKRFRKPAIISLCLIVVVVLSIVLPVTYAPRLVFVKVKGGYYVMGTKGVEQREVVIPAKHKGQPVIGIGGGTFYNNRRLRKVTIPASVKIIQGAFGGCSNLTIVDLLENSQLESIEGSVFSGIPLEYFEIPASLRHIGNSTFNSSSFPSITIHDEVLTDAWSPFLGNNGLTFYMELTSFPSDSNWNRDMKRPMFLGMKLSEDKRYVVSFEMKADSILYPEGINAPFRKGHTFAGWATAEGGDAVYTAEKVYTAPIGTALWAVWVPN